MDFRCTKLGKVVPILGCDRVRLLKIELPPVILHSDIHLCLACNLEFPISSTLL